MESNGKVKMKRRGGLLDVFVWDLGTDGETPGWYLYGTFPTDFPAGKLWRELDRDGYWE